MKAATQHLEAELPLVLYAEPHSPVLKGLFQQSKALNIFKGTTDSGFVFSPFDLQENPRVLLHPDRWLATDIARNVRTSSGGGSPKADKIGKQIHINLVKQALNAIDQGDLRKVIVSRRMGVDKQEAALTSFEKLMVTYPAAYCYLWFHPEIGLWMGASPELLARLDAGTFSTVALAGTLPYFAGQQPQWREKELQEQAWVSNYIRQILQPYGQQVQEEQSENVRAGHLWHLKSKFTIQLKDEDWLTLVDALHPTPAVGGLPKAQAIEFIRNHENYNREYYTGFFGELNMGSSQTAQLYVNLRCAQLREQNWHLYVGGGITQDSNPEEEWEEVQQKSLTLLQILDNSHKN